MTENVARGERRRNESAGPHEQDELLTITEVAAIVRAPVATLRYWRHLGIGPRSFRVGRGVRYWRRDILNWLDQQSDEDGPHAA